MKKWMVIFFSIFIIFMVQEVDASLIGYNFTEYNNQTYLWIWNNGTIEPNYYYENECLDQVSNDLDTQWEHVIKGIYNGHPQHNDTYIINMDDCLRSDDTDNLTYVTNSAFSEIQFDPQHQNRWMKLNLTSHIETNDDHITQNYTFQLKPGLSTAFDQWFFLKETDIKIGGDQANDYVVLMKKVNITIWNGTGMGTYETHEKEWYNLSHFRATNTSIVINGSEYMDAYFVEDYNQKVHIQNDFRNNGYNWLLKIDGNVTLFVNLKTFFPYEKKSFVKRWVDAGCACFAKVGGVTAYCLGWCSGGSSACNNYVGGAFDMNARVVIMNGECHDCYFYYETNQTGSWNLIQTSSGNQLRCNETICREEDVGNTETKEILCEEIGQTNVRIQYQASICGGSDPSAVLSPQPSTCAEHDIRLISPADQSTNPPGNISFSYNFTRTSDVSSPPINCSVIINGVKNTTSTDTSLGYTKQIGTILGLGSFNWSVNCTGIEETNFPRQNLYIMNYTNLFNTQYILSTTRAFNVKNLTWLDMNGTTNYISSQKSSGIITNTATTNYSVSMWFYHEGYWVGSWSDQQALFSTRAGSTSSPYFYLTLRSEQYQMRICDSDSCDIVTEPQEPGQWNHILAVYGDSPDGNLTLYLNGKWAGTNDNTGGWEDNNQEDFWLGGASGFKSFNGSIDEVRIYNRSLTQTEAELLNASGRRANSTLLTDGLIVYLPFNEDSGTASYDIRERFANVTINGGENITWNNDGVLLDIGSGNYTITPKATYSEVNLTNKDYDSSWLNLSYTQGGWEEWEARETWIINIADISAKEANWLLALMITFVGVILVIMGLFVTTDRSWLGIAWIILILGLFGLMGTTMQLGIHAHQGEINNSTTYSGLQSATTTPLFITSNLIWIIGSVLVLGLLIMMIKQFYLKKLKNT